MVARHAVLCWIVVAVAVAASAGRGEAHYLSAWSRWIVRESGGTRVKLACVNWAAHLEPMVAEGLNRQPIYRAAKAVKAMGFNCVRLTWATQMVTREEFAAKTVAERLRALNLTTELRGVALHNPAFVNLTLVEAFRGVASILGRAGLYVVADNHVSQPQWCCGDKDGNGFWGDPSFDPSEWLRGLSSIASLSLSIPRLVAISLRNELRGPSQNLRDWSKFMSMGAIAVSSVNPRLLIIISGLHSDTDLHFLPHSHLSNLSSFQNKLAYEMHWYASSYGVNFEDGNLNQACAIATSSFVASGAFMAAPNATTTTPSSNFSAPLFISEFGVDQRGSNRAHNRYISCLFAFVAAMDLDWSYWALQGNYYTRNGRRGDEEYMGILNSGWNASRNLGFLARLQAIQQPWQGVEGNSSTRSRGYYHVLFHPASGSCLLKGAGNSLLLGPCGISNNTAVATTHWRHSPQGRLEMLNSFLCIAAQGEGQSVKLEVIGTEKNGPWNTLSVAKLQFGTKIQHDNIGNHADQSIGKDGAGVYDQLEDRDRSSSIGQHLITSDATQSLLLCLDGRNPPSVTTEKCLCVQDDRTDCGRNDDPSHQWFVLVPANVYSKTSLPELASEKKTLARRTWK